MNRKETLKTLAVLKVAYPMFYAKQSASDMEAAVNLWEGQFASVEYEIVNAAVQSLVSTRTDTFPPNIGEVKAEVSKLERPGQLTPVEAWNKVLRALKNSSYHAREEWEKLPEPCRELITPEAMREMAISDNFNPGVEGSLFQRSYQAALTRKSEMQMLPDPVKAMVSKSLNMLEPK